MFSGLSRLMDGGISFSLRGTAAKRFVYRAGLRPEAAPTAICSRPFTVMAVCAMAIRDSNAKPTAGARSHNRVSRSRGLPHPREEPWVRTTAASLPQDT